jgi:hypothetical protein
MYVLCVLGFVRALILIYCDVCRNNENDDDSHCFDINAGDHNDCNVYTL